MRSAAPREREKGRGKGVERPRLVRKCECGRLSGRERRRGIIKGGVRKDDRRGGNGVAGRKRETKKGT